MRKSKVLNICKTVAKYDFEKFMFEDLKITNFETPGVDVECMGFKFNPYDEIDTIIFRCIDLYLYNDKKDVYFYTIIFDEKNNCILDKKMYKCIDGVNSYDHV